MPSLVGSEMCIRDRVEAAHADGRNLLACTAKRPIEHLRVFVQGHSPRPPCAGSDKETTPKRTEIHGPVRLGRGLDTRPGRPGRVAADAATHLTDYSRDPRQEARDTSGDSARQLSRTTSVSEANGVGAAGTV